MAIRECNFKFDFTAVNEDERPHYDNDEIVIRLDATLIMSDTAGEYVDISYVLEAFKRIGFPEPVFKYGNISATKEIKFSEFLKEWEIMDTFGLQLTYYKDKGYLFNLYTPRDVIPKKR